jgi:TM2 domain-containing membrane protein YozV
MPLTDPLYTRNMTDHQRAWFYAEYEHARKDEVIGVLLAIFFGGFGIHHFYLRRNGLGVLYLVFFWTGISAIFGLIDAFFTPDRVRRYNATQAIYISSQILADTTFSGPTGPPPPAAPQCSACGGPIDPTAAFCSRCGTATTGSDLRLKQAT